MESTTLYHNAHGRPARCNRATKHGAALGPREGGLCQHFKGRKVGNRDYLNKKRQRNA